MNELVLVSTRQLALRSLVETALANEVRLLEAAIRRTERRLCEFEATYGMTTQDFLLRFENDELDETLEYAEWVGEYRLLQRLKEKNRSIAGDSVCELRRISNSFVISSKPARWLLLSARLTTSVAHTRAFCGENCTSRKSNSSFSWLEISGWADRVLAGSI